MYKKQHINKQQEQQPADMHSIYSVTFNTSHRLSLIQQKQQQP